MSGAFRFIIQSFFSRALFSLLLGFILSAATPVLAEPLFLKKNIIIAYDISGSVTGRPELLNRVNRYLDDMLFQGLNSSMLTHGDTLYGEAPNPFQESGDGLTFLSFGMQQGALQEMARGNQSVWIRDFTQTLINREGFVHHVSTNQAQRALANYLTRVRSQRTQYTLSRFLFPFVLASLPQDIYAKETILIVISDFRYGMSMDDIGDREVVRTQAGLKFLRVLEDKQKVLKKYFDNSRHEMEVNVGGVNGIFIVVMKVRTEMPFEGNFVNPPDPLTLTRRKGEPTYPFPKIVFQTNGLGEWIQDIQLGWRQPAHEGHPASLRWGKITFQGNDIVAELPPHQTEVGEEENPPTRNEFILAGRYQMEDWGLGFYKESRPFKMAFATKLPYPETHPYHTASAVGLLGLAGFWLFGRVRPLEALFPSEGSFIGYRGVNCRLFECEPNSNVTEFLLIRLLLKKKRTWANWGFRVRAGLDLHIEPGGFPVKSGRFETNGQTSLKINRLPRHGEIVTIEIPIHKISLEDLWDHDLENPKDPFEIRVTIRQKAWSDHVGLTLYGLLVLRPSQLWLGLDPGTSGSCVFGGFSADELTHVPLTDQGELIMDSIITFKENFTQPHNPPYDPDFVRCGEIHTMGGIKTFSSAKRLIGYDNKFVVKPEVLVSGEYVQSVLIDYLVSKAGEQPQLWDKDLPPTQAVVAVPNSFTPAKIKLMKDCCLQARNLKRVEHIYEIEAILLYYYLKQRGKLTLPLTILVVDFGGSTLNLAVATFKEEPGEEKLDIDIHSRMGFNIGGDTITAILARGIWENQNHKKEILQSFKPHIRDKFQEGLDPFADPQLLSGEDKKSWEKVCDSLWNIAETEKKNFINGGIKKYPGLEEFPPLQDCLAKIGSYVKEVVDYFQPSPQRVIDAVIIAGRGSLFPPVQQQLASIVQNLHDRIGKTVKEIDPFTSNDERKFCVAAGAAFFGIHKGSIRLTRDKTFAHYGVELYEKPGVKNFHTMIPMGTIYQNGEARSVMAECSLAHQNSLAFHQVIASDPEIGFHDLFRKRMIQKFNISETDKFLKEATIILDTNDSCKIKIWSTEGKQESMPSFHVTDINTEMDGETTWRLKIQGLQTPKEEKS